MCMYRFAFHWRDFNDGTGSIVPLHLSIIQNRKNVSRTVKFSKQLSPIIIPNR